MKMKFALLTVILTFLILSIGPTFAVMQDYSNGNYEYDYNEEWYDPSDWFDIDQGDVYDYWDWDEGYYYDDGIYG